MFMFQTLEKVIWCRATLCLKKRLGNGSQWPMLLPRLDYWRYESRWELGSRINSAAFGASQPKLIRAPQHDFFIKFFCQNFYPCRREKVRDKKKEKTLVFICCSYGMIFVGPKKKERKKETKNVAGANYWICSKKSI